MTMLLSASQPTTSDAQQLGETDPERTLAQVLASIAELASLVAQRGLQIERERRLPADLIDALSLTLAISGWVARGFHEAVEERARDCCRVLGLPGR